MSQLESQLKLGNYGAMYSKFLELRLSRVESPDDLLDLLSSFPGYFIKKTTKMMI